MTGIKKKPPSEWSPVEDTSRIRRTPQELLVECLDHTEIDGVAVHRESAGRHWE